MSGPRAARPSAIVTRPEPEAQIWVEKLRGRGICAAALPLIAIRPLSGSDAIVQAWRDLGAYKAMMFVSRFAVEAFFAHRPIGPLPGPDARQVRMWSTGPGTRAALLRHGVAAALLDAPAPDCPRFDSEALWAVVAGQIRPDDRVLVVRGLDGEEVSPNGGSGRDWLAQRLQGAGAQVRFVVAYQRLVPRWDLAQTERALSAATDGSVWVFTSAQAMDHLKRLLPTQSWSAARALATHPRITNALRAAGFGVLRETQPDLDSVVASIESLG